MNARNRFASSLLAVLCLTACGGGGGDGGSTGSSGGASSGGGSTSDFSFSTQPRSAYARVDRMGQPVVATVLLHTEDKDHFNGTDPAEDGDFSALMLERLEELHTGLDDALIAKGITPCALDVCARQVVNKIIPDTLQLDLSKPDGFPNGRRFEDITVDRILSMALADTTTPGDCYGHPCDVHAFENLPNNPTRNESPFLAQFPYLAAPHPPP